MMHNKYLEIMKHFFRGYRQEIYGRELIGKVSISQKNIALTLNELESEGILSSKSKGNAKYYSLNTQNSVIKNYLMMFEVERAIDFLKSRKKIAQILGKIDGDIDILIVFGSYAKDNEKRDSDLDLFVVGEFDEKEIKKIGETYNIKISVKGGSYTNFANSLKTNNPLMNEILENHVIIIGYEKFVNEVTRQKW